MLTRQFLHKDLVLLPETEVMLVLLIQKILKYNTIHISTVGLEVNWVNIFQQNFFRVISLFCNNPHSMKRQNIVALLLPLSCNKKGRKL